MKYFIDGKTARSWCMDNGYSLSFVLVLLKKGLTADEIKKQCRDRYADRFQDAISEAVEAIKRARSYTDMYNAREALLKKIGRTPDHEAMWDGVIAGKYTINETWKPTPESPRYQISSLGRARKLMKNGNHYLLSVQLKQAKRAGSEYNFLTVRIAGHDTNLAKAVAEAFVPKIPGCNWVYNIDGNPENCKASNLRWISRKEALQLYGYTTRRPKQIQLLNDAGLVIETFDSAWEAAEKLKVSYQTIINYCTNSIQKPKFHIRYKKGA
ncbi:MAG: hypothetical protein HF308_18295 [Ignavibacteria bacterium]|jgi:hypothetical protein|nr:hypothetical protein [Ignavibacteria bacterium]MCU7526433.1 hypothetical protein [Ignavibacteria bacterium]